MASFIAKRFGNAMLNRTGKTRFISTGTSPTFKPAIGVADGMLTHPSGTSQIKGEWAPVAVIIGFVGTAVIMGVHTMIQQLGRSPSVKVSKKNRETISEVFDPDSTLATASRGIDKSFFRKIGKIQDPKYSSSLTPDTFTRSREIESLKSVGALH